MIFSDEHIEKIRNYDFFKKCLLDETNEGLETVKAWGSYQDRIPFVSFVVTTYKRPHYLKLALESIIRQSFNDYEIIVVDNECAVIEADTETQILIKSLNNPRIVYFRNINPMNARMDRGASLARGEWLCFCHDDDMFAANHLETMVHLVKSHPEINFLSCPYRTFSDNDYEKIKQNGFIANNRHGGRGEESCLQEGVFFHQGPWTGALIKRKLYKKMGGTPKISLGCGDMLMGTKFIYWYSGFYRLNAPLFFYRLSDSQVSRKHDNWLNTFISDFFFYKYALKKVNGIPKINNDYLSLAFVLEGMAYTEKYHGVKIDLDLFCKKCGLEKSDFDFNLMNQYVETWMAYERQLNQEKEHIPNKRFEFFIEKIAKLPYM